MEKREDLKKKIDNLMNQYDKEKIDGDTYLTKMMDLTSSFKKQQKKNDSDDQ